ncbi:unnamed protein product [Arctogadus glacialis]
MKGKSLDDIEIEDELAASDAEANDGSDSEASDTEDLPTECGTSEPEPAEVVPVLSSTGSEPAPPSEVKTGSDRPAVPGKPSMSSRRASGKDSGKEHGSWRKAKVWSKVEVAAVMRHFKGKIQEGKLASVNECNHCKAVEAPTLKDRTVQNLRDFVRNRGITAKRQALVKDQ